MTSRPPPLETVELGPADAEASVVWLHGLGADGHDFVPAVETLSFAGKARVRFVLPHAPVRPVTLNGGLPMRAWFDIYAIEPGAPQDEAGLRGSAAAVAALLAREAARGVPPERQVLAGFSQGGATALFTGLRQAQPLAGIMVLSGWLPLADAAAAEATAAGRGTPVFMAHGRRDPVVPIALGQAARRRLEALGCTVEWHEYDLDHSVSLDELADIGRWLERVLGLAASG